MDRGPWGATVQKIAKSQTVDSFCFHCRLYSKHHKVCPFAATCFALHLTLPVSQFITLAILFSFLWIKQNFNIEKCQAIINV